MRTQADTSSILVLKSMEWRIYASIKRIAGGSHGERHFNYLGWILSLQQEEAKRRKNKRKKL